MFVTTSDPTGFSIKAWQGDAKTLLAFNFTNAEMAKNLAGFSIRVQPHGQQSYYLLNSLVLPAGGNAKLGTEPNPDSSANAPIQKFRWLHVPGTNHQTNKVFYGIYTYTVTPRYFKGTLLDEFNPALSLSIDVQVAPFSSGQLQLGFTRGFVQSQAFARNFGQKALIRPAGKALVFDTGTVAGTNTAGQTFTYLQEYQWSGFTAREQIFNILAAVSADNSLTLDFFAYDLNEPDLVSSLFQLAASGRVRVILDNNPSLHGPGTPEDVFTQSFTQVAKSPAAIQRGKFGRYAHDKVMIVYKDKQPVKVLTGSTNFSVTGIYVNSNHVLVFNNGDVAGLYAKVFQAAWDEHESETFNQSPLAASPAVFNQMGLPKMSITFSPHTVDIATGILQGIADRVNTAADSVLFAVMGINVGDGPVYPALKGIHAKQTVFSYGISDTPGGIYLYKPGNQTGVLVGGKPGVTVLPPPFDQVHAVAGHQIHDKFVICDFNTPNAVVYCGSSNLALGGEQENGDNLIQINDPDIAAVFALEAIALVDHFDFLDAKSSPKAATASTAKKGDDHTPPEGTAADHSALYLFNNDSWAQRYFNVDDLHQKDRLLFGWTG